MDQQEKIRADAEAFARVISGSIEAALQKTIPVEYFASTLISVLVKSPKLMAPQARPSLIAAIVEAAQLGLDLAPSRGLAYLVPFKNEVKLIPGYQGFIELARRGGTISQVWTGVVRSGDFFEVDLGQRRRLVHQPDLLGSDERPWTHVYACARWRDVEDVDFIFLSRSRVETIRDRSSGYQYARQNRSPSPWIDDEERMAEKTAIRALAKRWPLSGQLAKLIEIDDRDYVEDALPAAEPANAVTVRTRSEPPAEPRKPRHRELEAGTLVVAPPMSLAPRVREPERIRPLEEPAPRVERKAASRPIREEPGATEDYPERRLPRSAAGFEADFGPAPASEPEPFSSSSAPEPEPVREPEPPRPSGAVGKLPRKELVARYSSLDAALRKRGAPLFSEDAIDLPDGILAQRISEMVAALNAK